LFVFESRFVLCDKSFDTLCEGVIFSVFVIWITVKVTCVCFMFLQDYIGAPCLRLEVMGCTRLECTDINECKVNNGGCDQKCVNG
jgi:hypothetical protein